MAGEKNVFRKERRAHGEGSIYQRKDGTWAGVVRYEDPETGEKKKHFVYGKTRKEAANKKKDFEDKLEKGIVPKTEKITVGKWLDDWLEIYARVRVRQNTFEGYQRIVNGHLKPDLGKIKINDLKPRHVQKMLNEKLERGNKRTGGPLGPRQVEYIYAVLHMALEQAVKDNIITRNVCDAVDKPQKVKREFMPWTVEQTNQFLSSVKDERLFPLYMVAWGTGLRRSEILGLKWDDIDLKKGNLTVRRTLVRVKGNPPYQFGEPKTPKSRRTIPLPGPVVQALKKWKAQQAQEALVWKGLHKDVPEEQRPPYNPLNLVFCTEIGEPMNPEFISRTFKRDLKRAGLPEIRFHDLRHGHATMLLELGEDIKIISDRLGHSTITLTADTYSHVREKLQRQASNKLEQVLNLNN